MSDQKNQVTNGKLPNTDPSLLLTHQPRINKKFIKVILVCFAGVFAMAVVFAYTPKQQKPKKDTSVDAAGNIIIRRPGDLDITASDYLPKKDSPDAADDVPFDEAVDSYYTDYGIYDQRPQVEMRESPRQNQPLIGRIEDPNDPESAYRRSERRSIFHDALPVAITPIDLGQTASAPAGYNPTINTSLLENAYASDYQKQNMNSIKEDYLRNARSAEDFSSYLSTMYLPPIDPYHEIKAGTFIPITLITAIHSDLPGPIEAQVIENVYDTYSGRNVLIPRGTRVHGDYSSSVAFGQNRVLIVWQRMTLPDGVSINLQGMQGVDLRGMSGLADRVDHHISEMLLAVGVATVFDLGKAAATTALSTVDILKDINNILTAQGSASAAANSAAQQIVINYANKLMNQQPTITIREGIRGNIFVSKDVILPSYGAYRY